MSVNSKVANMPVVRKTVGGDAMISAPEPEPVSKHVLLDFISELGFDPNYVSQVVLEPGQAIVTVQVPDTLGKKCVTYDGLLENGELLPIRAGRGRVLEQEVIVPIRWGVDE